MANIVSSLLVRLGVDADDVQKGMDKATDIVESAGPAMAAAGGAVGAVAVAGFSKGFLDGLEIEAASDKVAAQLRLTEDESARVGDVAGDLFSNAYGENIGQVNEALRGVIAQTGDLGDITDTELSDMGAAALNLASILGTDVTRVTQIAGQAVKNNLAGNMTEAFNLIAASSAETMPGLEGDLLDAADEYGTFFASLGFKGEEAFGALAKASEQGAFGIDKTGDAIKEFTIRATDMSATSRGAFDEIGLDAEEMSNKILAGGDTAKGAFDEIVDGLLGIEDPTTQANTAIALFGTPIEDLNTAQIPEFLSNLDSTTSSLKDVAGATDEMGDTLADNAQSKITAMSNSFTTWLADLVNAPGLVGDTTAAIAGVGAVAGPAVGNIAMLATAFGGFGGIVGGIASAAKAMGLFAAAISTATLAGIKNLAIMVAQRTAMLAGAIITGVVTAATWLWNIALTANPVGLIILAIVALIGIIVLLVSNWDTVLAWLEAAWNWIKEVAVATWTAIKDFLVSLWQSIMDLIGEAIDWVIWLFENFTPLGLIISNWEGIWTWIKNLWNKITDWIGDKIDDIGGFLSGMWDGITDGLKGALNAAIGLINNAIGGINVLIDGANYLPGVNISHIPKIPLLADGGIVTGPTLAMIGEGADDEAVIPLPRGMRSAAFGGGGGPMSLEINSGGSRLDDLLVEVLARAIRVRGGDVQTVLGARS